jgi:hypothetical protein
MPPKPRLILKRGDEFDKLTVTDPDMRKNGDRAALCACSCGTPDVLVLIKHLVHGRVRSCGCIKREQTAERNRATASRGGATTHPLWPHWAAMMNRCYNPAAGNYQWYGGADPPVTVCREWAEDPWAFIRYVERELGPRPSAKHSIDRERGANYEPGKVRWADPIEQARNRRPYGTGSSGPRSRRSS